jgi:hypothetical protein
MFQPRVQDFFDAAELRPPEIAQFRRSAGPSGSASLPVLFSHDSSRLSLPEFDTAQPAAAQ